ncbi:hypothetical protein K502DRAFT_325303 [Neoconidiobolus thromboides FSU 785]|nr:hypothetical protein K502DRAFT_325303 [Neoconidiobolus thromboides FSU 785]
MKKLALNGRKIKRDPEAENWDLQTAFKHTIKWINNLKDVDKRNISEMFIELPSKEDYPDYYKEIKRPISIKFIQKKVQKEEYKDWDAFFKDWLLLTDNAKQYNMPDSEIYEDADNIMKGMRRVSQYLKYNPFMKDIDLNAKGYKKEYYVKKDPALEAMMELEKEINKIERESSPNQEEDNMVDGEKRIIPSGEKEVTYADMHCTLQQIFDAKWNIVKKYIRTGAIIDGEILSKLFVHHDITIKDGKNYKKNNMDTPIKLTFNNCQVYFTPLQSASFFGRIRGLLFLLGESYSPDTVDPMFNLNALEWGALGGNPKVCYHLLKVSNLDIETSNQLHASSISFDRYHDFENWRKSILKDNYIPLDQLKFEEGSVSRYFFKHGKAYYKDGLPSNEINDGIGNINMDFMTEVEEKNMDNTVEINVKKETPKRKRSMNLKLSDQEMKEILEILEAHKIYMKENILKRLKKNEGEMAPIEISKQCSLILNELFNQILEYTDKSDNKPLVSYFANLPPIEDYPDYYEIITSPINIIMIKNRINAIKSISDLDKNIKLLTKNVQEYYDQNHPLVKKSIVLEFVYDFLSSELLKLGLNKEINVKQYKSSGLLTYYYDGVIYSLGDNVLVYDQELNMDVIISISCITRKGEDAYITGSKFIFKDAIPSSINYGFEPNEVFKTQNKNLYVMGAISRKCCLLFVKKYQCYYSKDHSDSDTFFYEFIYAPSEQNKFKPAVDRAKYISVYPYFPYRLVEREASLNLKRVPFAKKYSCTHKHSNNRSNRPNNNIGNIDLGFEPFLIKPPEEEEEEEVRSSSLSSEGSYGNIEEIADNSNFYQAYNESQSYILYTDESFNESNKRIKYDEDAMIDNIDIKLNEINVNYPLRIIQNLTIISFQGAINGINNNYTPLMRHDINVNESAYSLRVPDNTSFIYVAIEFNSTIPVSLQSLLRSDLRYEDLPIKSDIPKPLREALNVNLPNPKPWREWLLKVGTELGVVNLKVFFRPLKEIETLRLNQPESCCFNELEILTIQDL